jgi:hypothetical protein
VDVNDRGAPALSVVLVASGGFDAIRATLRHLRAQSVAGRLEVVIVAPSAALLGLDAAETTGFHGVEIVEVGPLTTLGEPKAAGIRRASAPVVALTEDHAYPQPGWAAALIEAHRGPWAAVGPAIGNANPDSMLSWANLLIAYGRWVAPAAAGPIDDVPGHNSSYKRALLLAYGPALGGLLEREGALHRDLRAKGHRLYLEPAARTDHQNFSLASASAKLRFNAGRLFAATRVREGGWSPPRRLLYVASTPLIPAIHLRRILGEMRRGGTDRALLPRVLPALLFLLLVAGAGEMVGYALGPGPAPEVLNDFEFNRDRYLTARDRQSVPAR